jgi:hypothetical protein
MTATHKLSELIQIGPLTLLTHYKCVHPLCMPIIKDTRPLCMLSMTLGPHALFAAIVNAARKIFHVPYICNPSIPYTQYNII